MKRLRLFIGNNLDELINWQIINNDESIESGASTFAEISTFKDISIEVYLSAACCNIFKIKTEGISAKNFTEELTLGLIEDKIAEEIEESKAITLRVEDNIAYVAVFNKLFYESLLRELNKIDASLIFIQSFVYATTINDNCWTLYLTNNQRFLRVSKYEYYSLDDTLPLPAMLNDIFAENKPEQLLVYTDNSSSLKIEQIAKELEVECIDANGHFEYGVMVWNFNMERSTSFNIKLDQKTKLYLLQLLNFGKYLFYFILLFWIINCLILNYDIHKIKVQIGKNLQGVVSSPVINSLLLPTATKKISDLRHQRGIYDDKDAIVLLTKFLEVDSNISYNDIKQVNYDNGVLVIILGSSFDTSEFSSYKNVLETRRVIANIQDYKTYNNNHKQQNANNGNNSITDQTTLINDHQWVITLRPSLWQDVNKNN
jgi:hypothetical protein